MSNEELVLANGQIPAPANREEFYQQVAQEKTRAKVKGLTGGQQDLLDAINQCTITLCSGCAGTGKTYIPVVRAVELYKEGKYKRIVIARPNIECGNTLGFLPGDEQEKMNPYMKHIMDILLDQFDDHKELNSLIECGTIELCSLTLMRGRSLNNAVMILDEAQNASWEQLVMFLTRIGQNSKIIVTGDEKQKDIFNDAYDQCLDKFDMAEDTEIDVVFLDERDIVRNGIIRRILHIMGTYEKDYEYGNSNG